MKILSRQRLLSTGGMVCALLAGPMAPSRAEIGVPAKQIVVGQSAAFIREMKKANSNPQFITVSFVGSRALANVLGEAWRGAGITQVVPFPWNLDVPVVTGDFAVRYSPDDHSGSRFVELTVITKQRRFLCWRHTAC